MKETRCSVLSLFVSLFFRAWLSVENNEYQQCDHKYDPAESEAEYSRVFIDVLQIGLNIVIIWVVRVVEYRDGIALLMIVPVSVDTASFKLAVRLYIYMYP